MGWNGIGVLDLLLCFVVSHSLPPSLLQLPAPNREVALDMSLQTPSAEAVKVKEENPVEVDSSPPGSPDSFSSMSDSSRDTMVRRGKVGVKTKGT